MVSLYLPSDYSQHPTTTLLQWFVELLQTKRGPYHTLAKVVHGLKHPAAYAEVKQYSCHHQQQAELKVNRWAIVAEIEQEDEALSGIKHCMEAYSLYERLTHLKGHLNIHHELPVRNYALYHLNSCHHHRGGPGGPP